ncbi:hypothetical protein ABPG74_001857 [Tetrahymena malaccensis]
MTEAKANTDQIDFQMQEKGSGPVDISFKNIQYSVQVGKTQRDILKDLSGFCQSGTVTAILGASGGGKTSLLNVLSGKIVNGGKVTLKGQIMANGHVFSNEQFNRFSAYVMQDDILVSSLTVRECIQFAADLKLSGTNEYKQQKVNEMISLLKLTKCQNALIGSKLIKGVSGGERKRANIGCELITDPSVIFLDEPTSGLDSFTAYIVISILKDFAKIKQKTVIMSIHSPNTDIWNLFDNVNLMVQGKFIYQGPREQIISHFSKIGFQCPKYICPGDYLMQYMTHSERNDALLPSLLEGYEMYLKDDIDNTIDKNLLRDDIPLKSTTTTFLYQVSKIAKRTFISTKRDPMLLKSRVIQTIIISLFIGLVYLNQSKITEDSPIRDVQDRISLLFLCTLNMFLKSMSGVLVTFPSEREVFLKECNSKYYTAQAYIVGRLLLEYLQITIYPIINTVIIYFMTGLNQQEASLFFYFLLVSIALSYCGNALGLLCGNLFTDPRTAVAVQPLLSIPFYLFCGFYKNRQDYASWIGWIQYLSPLTYSTEGVVTNEFYGITGPIDPVSQSNYNLGKWNCLGYIVLLFVGYQALAFVIFYNKRKVLQ